MSPDDPRFVGTRPPHLKNAIPCEAFKDWPAGRTLCNEPALFEVERVAQVGMNVCAHHLGPVLQYAHDVIWPPDIRWLGPDFRPQRALERGGLEHKRRQDAVFGPTSDPPVSRA